MGEGHPTAVPTFSRNSTNGQSPSPACTQRQRGADNPAFAMRQPAQADKVWCPRKQCTFPKHEMPKVSDQEWQERISKRHASLELVKRLEEYSRCLTSGRQLPPAPDATDRTVSKRRWEEQVMNFRHAVKRLAISC